MSGFAEVKEEGKKLWPHTYFIVNGVPPRKSFYTKEELSLHKEKGYTDEDYLLEMDNDS